jgi:hypothetical protein
VNLFNDGKLWEPWEIAVLRKLYPNRRTHAKLYALLTDRTPVAIRVKAYGLGINSRPYWTRADKAYLRNWPERSVRTLAQHLRRPCSAVWAMIRAMELPLGVPQGCISIEEASRRENRCRESIRVILREQGATIYRHEGYRGRGESVRHYIELDELRRAIDAHEEMLRTTDTIRGAARTRGLCPQMLARWMSEALDLEPYRRGPVYRIPGEVFDRVIAERRAKHPARRAA